MYLYHRINLNIYSSNMEQAVNTFNKGLQTDTNPMIQGNDTVTDCLNGTLVTMNGNEIVLQNDMGNRRVDNAFLPEGYEPVGMKEYGGIIYIAAYNPITNRSQIGSFPSPERRISSHDDENLGNSFDLDISLFGTKQSLSLGLTCLEQDTVLLPLTDDISLHAGDKFIVYSNNFINNPQKYITNYNNVYGTKAKSPKNKQYTLSLGILNAQNEFVDITSSLVRWDGNQIMTDSENETDLHRFNKGYFICEGNYQDIPNEIQTISDTILDEEREHAYQVMKANTYAYKLVGPLYLQIKYNHIQDFSYNIYGTYDGSKAELFVEGFITYNCPDGVSLGGDSDSNYVTYSEGFVNNLFGYDFIIDGDNNYTVATEGNPKCKYDPNTNLYNVKIVKKIGNITPVNNKIDYTIGVKANNNSSNKCYLEGLSSKGSIDVTKLGSGTIDLIGYRFINNYQNKSGTITYTLDAYPKYNEEFRNFRLKFTNVISQQNSQQNEVIITAQPNNGKTNLEINWSEEESNNEILWDRALYKVEFLYDVYDRVANSAKTQDIPLEISDNLSKTEFYLTTELFNSWYSPNSSDYISDYGYPDGEHHISTYNSTTTTTTTHGKRDIVINKLTINPDITTSYKLSDTPISNQLEGSLVTTDNQNDNTITMTYNKEIDISFSGTLDINENLYPSYISFTRDLTNIMSLVPNDTHSNINELSSIGAQESNPTITNAQYKSTLKWEDSIIIKKEDLKQYDGELTNVFNSFYSYLYNHNASDYLSYSGVLLQTQDHAPGDDEHGVYVNINRNNCLGSVAPENGVYGEIQVVYFESDLTEGSGDTRWRNANDKLKASKYNLQAYYDNIDSNKVFAILGQDQGAHQVTGICRYTPTYKNGPIDFDGSLEQKGNNYFRNSMYSRLMWKSTTGWAYVNLYTPIKIQDTEQSGQTGEAGNNSIANDKVKKFLTGNDCDVFKKLYYRRYKKLDSQRFDIYVPKNTPEYDTISEKFKLIYKLSFSNDTYISNLNNGSAVMTFIKGDSQIESEKTINIFDITSGEDFLDLIMSEPTFSNYIIEDDNIITNVDYTGKQLSVNKVYIKDSNGKFHEAENSFPVKVYIQDSNETFLVCVSKKGYLKLKCDFGAYSGADSHTWFTYDSVDKIDLTEIKNIVNSI